MQSVLLCALYPFQALPGSKDEVLDFIKVVFGAPDVEFRTILDALRSKDAEMACMYCQHHL